MFEIFYRMINFIPNLFRRKVLDKTVQQMKTCVENGLMDEFLDILLEMMRLLLCVDAEFRKNIKNFNAKYTFKSPDDSIAVSAIFKRNQMKVKRKELANTNITVIFKDGQALWEFLMSGDPDIFAFILDNKLSYQGNLNYVLKFGYMAKRMQLMFGL